MRIGYARVSTIQQDTALQRAAFKRAGVGKVVEEKRSGAASRPLLEGVLKRLKPGDVLVVYKVDRLARSLPDLLRILQRVREAGASFRSLTEPLETATPVGQLLLHMLGAIAQFERSIIRERCMAGRAEAVLRGVRFGSPITIPRAAVLELRAKGLLWREVAERLGCSKCQVMRAASGLRVGDGGPGLYRRVS